ncbi:MAG: hypothetical protein NC340_09890 [Ruminococcus flavefaciens]|nr:hypothetical protein [Ruminococcus flavefaciens]MCM1231386.1 hypothetical protein [Ruminococcus flavefaciens]
MDEEIISQEQEVQEDEADVIPEEDNAELLEIDNIRRKKEGRADDSATMQMALCMIIAVGLIILNIFNPDTAEALFLKLRDISGNGVEIIPNPIDMIAGYIKNI